VTPHFSLDPCNVNLPEKHIHQKYALTTVPMSPRSCVGMSEDDIRAWKDALDSSASADELKAAVGRGIELVNARLADLQARYPRRAKAPPELLSPKPKATLDRLRQWTAPGGGSR